MSIILLVSASSVLSIWFVKDLDAADLAAVEAELVALRLAAQNGVIDLPAQPGTSVASGIAATPSPPLSFAGPTINSTVVAPLIEPGQTFPAGEFSPELVAVAVPTVDRDSRIYLLRSVQSMVAHGVDPASIFVMNAGRVASAGLAEPTGYTHGKNLTSTHPVYDKLIETIPVSTIPGATSEHVDIMYKLSNKMDAEADMMDR